MRFVFGYYEICLFCKNLQINCDDIFNVSYVLEKYWYVLECSWIVLEFSLQKSLAALEKSQIWISQEQKEFLRLIKKHFLWFLKDYHLVKKEKFDKK